MQFILVPRNPLAISAVLAGEIDAAIVGLLIQINPKVTDVHVENVIDTSFMTRLESSGFIQSVYKKH